MATSNPLEVMRYEGKGGDASRIIDEITITSRIE
jgi:hypothetical protein